MSDAEETTNPGIQPETVPEITIHDRARAKALADELKGSWVKRVAPVASLVLLALTLLIMGLKWGDGRWLPVAEAKEQRSQDKAKITEAHTTIKNTHTADMNHMTQLMSQEMHLRSLQGKDLEMTEKDVARLERRLSRVEDQQ